MQLSSPLKPSRSLWRRSGFFAFMLLLMVLVLLLAIVQVQHQVRLLETRYSEKLTEYKTLQEEWGRLSLEHNHLTAPARVEQLAIQKLGMKLVQPLQKEMPVIFIPSVGTSMNEEHDKSGVSDHSSNQDISASEALKP